MNTNDELLIEEMCAKFGELFKEIKELKSKRKSHDEENDKLQMLI